MKNSQQKILDAAERMVQKGGYNAFSFREIASEIGIKSSSVHYYYPTKADLGAAVVRKFTTKTMEYLGTPGQWVTQGQDPIQVLVQSFRDTLGNGSMCLCGLLGAEAGGLPDQIVEETKHYFEHCLEWLASAYELKNIAPDIARKKALQTLGMLEGAILMGRVMGDIDVFNDIADLCTADA